MLRFNNYLTQVLLVVLSTIVYSISFNFYIAVSLVTAIILHELGHFCAAKKLNLTVQGCYLVPYIGAILLITDKHKSYKEQVMVALAGPLSGCLFAILAFLLYIITNNLYLGSFVYIAAIINLGNLLPLSFLDGGQITDAILSSLSRKLGLLWKVISTIIIFIILFFINKIISIVTLLFFIPNILNTYLSISGKIEDKPLDKISLVAATAAITTYVLTIFLLLLLVYYLYYEGTII